LQTDPYFQDKSFAAKFNTPDKAVTGFKYGEFNLTSNILRANMPQGDYILSFWSTILPTLTVQGTTILKTKNDVAANSMGWRYNEYLISVPNSLNHIFLEGPIKIDELRIYGADATMKSTTFDIDFGLPSSTCDENNQISHFKYDELKRLTEVKDKDGKIMQAYGYNNPIANDFVPPIEQETCCFPHSIIINGICEVGVFVETAHQENSIDNIGYECTWTTYYLYSDGTQAEIINNHIWGNCE
jgi:hypothetical protein